MAWEQVQLLPQSRDDSNIVNENGFQRLKETCIASIGECYIRLSTICCCNSGCEYSSFGKARLAHRGGALLMLPGRCRKSISPFRYCFSLSYLPLWDRRWQRCRFTIIQIAPSRYTNVAFPCIRPESLTMLRVSTDPSDWSFALFRNTENRRIATYCE